MTNLEKYRLSIFERCDEGTISQDERDVLLEATRYTKEFDKDKKQVLEKRREIDKRKEEDANESFKKLQFIKDKRYISNAPEFIKKKLYDKKISKASSDHRKLEDEYINSFRDSLRIGNMSSKERGDYISRLMKKYKYNKDDIVVKEEISKAKKAKNILKETLGIK